MSVPLASWLLEQPHCNAPAFCWMLKLVAVSAIWNTQYALKMLPAQPPGMLQLSAARAGQLLAQPHRNTCSFSCILKSGVSPSSRDNQRINCLSKLAAWAASLQCFSLLDVHWSWLLLQSSGILSMQSLVKRAVSAAPGTLRPSAACAGRLPAQPHWTLRSNRETF